MSRAAVLLVVLALGGCIAASDSSRTVMPTLGKELEDLHAAYQKGVITQQEYDKAKKRLLEKGR